MKVFSKIKREGIVIPNPFFADVFVVKIKHLVFPLILKVCWRLN